MASLANSLRFLIGAVAALTIVGGVVARRVSAEQRRPTYDFPRAVQRLEEVFQAEHIQYNPEGTALTVNAHNGYWDFTFRAVPDKHGRVPVGGGLLDIHIGPDGQASILRGL